MTTYNIKRMFADRTFDSYIVKTGLTLNEAQKHCKDRETSSRTCKELAGALLTARCGPWFDGYNEE